MIDKDVIKERVKKERGKTCSFRI